VRDERTDDGCQLGHAMLVRSFVRSFTDDSSTHLLVHSPTRPLTYSSTHLLVHSPTRPLTYSSTHLRTQRMGPKGTWSF
jgi:hypothetical protein